MHVAHILKLALQGLGPVVPLALGLPFLALITAVTVLATKTVVSVAKAVISVVWKEAGKGYVADSVAILDDRLRARTRMPSRADSPWHRLRPEDGSWRSRSR
jgi:hypothetical protein